MAIVAEELPFVAVVDDDKLNTVCSNCFAEKGRFNPIDLIRCDNCRVINYCSQKCQEEDWKFHEDECQFIRKSGKFHSKDRMMSRIVMRVRRGDLPVAFNGRTYDDLMDHKDDIEKDVNHYFSLNVVYRGLAQFMGENAPTPEEFASFYGKRVINSFGIGCAGISQQYSDLGTGLYLGLAVHNHSCRPTADYYFIGSKIVLRAHNPNAKYSKDLTITYIPHIMPKNYRQKKLRSNYYFDCECERCADEEMELLERSGRSPCCPIKGAVLPIDKKFQFLGYWRQPLVCTNCGKKVDTTVEQINNYNETVEELCSLEGKLLEDVRCQADVDELIKLLDRAELFLSPYNLKLLTFTGVVTRAAEIVDKTSPLYGKCTAAEEKVREKYLHFVKEWTGLTVNTLKKECVEACNNPREIAFAKIDAACQKALDVVHRKFGPEHPLCKEIGQFSECLKSNYGINYMAHDGKEKNPRGLQITEFSGLNKILYDKLTKKGKKKTEEKRMAEAGDY